MKPTIKSIIALFLVFCVTALTHMGLAQDQETISIDLMSDITCNTIVHLGAVGDPLTAYVSQGDIVFVQVEIDPGAEASIPLPEKGLSYRVQVSSTAYTFQTQDLCPVGNPTLTEEEPRAGTPPLVEDDGYAVLEAEMFQRMGWGPEEISWFRNVYTPMYGDAEAYIYAVAELYAQLDAAEATPSTPSPNR